MGDIPELATASIQGVELLLPGTWSGSVGGTNTFTSGDLDQIVTAFQALKSVFTPVAKLGHARNQALLQSDGYPAAGQVTNLYRRGDALVADVDQIPAKVAALIKAGAYGPRSAELLFDADFGDRGTYPIVLKAFAWLGADAPAVTGLDDVLALYSREAAYSGGTVRVVELAMPPAHDPFTGTHSHAHPAYQSQGEDASHEHEHQHQGDANHDHHGAETGTEMAAATGDKQAQQARAKTYGIAVKDDNSNVTKPGQFAAVPDAQWGDPVNYRYPMADKAHADNAAARFAQMDGTGDYSAAEAKIVSDRIAARQQSFGEDPDASHSRQAALSDGTPATQTQVADADLGAQIVALLQQAVQREAAEQSADNDESDDIRGLLCAIDLVQGWVRGELADSLGDGVTGADGTGYAYYARPSELESALGAIKTHLDGDGKGKRGVGMARLAHKLLTAYAAQWSDKDTEGNTATDEGPEGERGAEQRGGVLVAHSRPVPSTHEGKETMQDSELRALLGLSETADLKTELIALKARHVDLSAHEAVQARVVELERKIATREAAEIVEQAIDAHKLAPRQREWAQTYALADRSGFEAFLSATPANAWSDTELGSAGDATPRGVSEVTLSVGEKLGVSAEQLTGNAAQPFVERVEAARKAALATAGKRSGGRA